MSHSSIMCHIGNTTINIDDKPHHCHKCERSFDKVSSLGLHMCSHYGIKPFFCNICNKGFNREPMYNEHVRSHTGERPFICKICSCRFTKVRSAKRHVIGHLFQKPFTCNKCNKGYFRKHDLNRHVRLAHMFRKKHFHNGASSSVIKDGYGKTTMSHSRRLYLCKICRKQFSSLSNLNKHRCSTMMK